jgi:maleylpyruvate isomerase
MTKRRVRLYSYWRSSASWRVRIALALKGIEYDYIAVNILENRQQEDDYKSLNPMAQVPALEIEHGNEMVRLTQSMAIIDFLESVVPEPPLYPSEPILRARAIEIAETINSGIQPLQNLSVLRALKKLGGDPDAWARERIAAGLAAVENKLSWTARKHAAGDSLTIADVLIVPQMFNARRFNVDLGPLPLLQEVEARAAEHPAFQKARPEVQPDAVAQ